MKFYIQDAGVLNNQPQPFLSPLHAAPQLKEGALQTDIIACWLYTESSPESINPFICTTLIPLLRKTAIGILPAPLTNTA